MSTKILQLSSSSNCHIEDEEFLELTEAISTNDLPVNEIFNVVENQQQTDIDFDSEIFSDMFLEDVFENSSAINLELTSIRYFVGFVGYKMLKKNKVTSKKRKLKIMQADC